jgi:hypothetical protein
MPQNGRGKRPSRGNDEEGENEPAKQRETYRQRKMIFENFSSANLYRSSG